MSLTAADPRNAVESGLRSVSRQTRSGRAEPFTVCIVGVDGCGKSSVFGGSTERLAGRMRVVGIGDVVLSGAPSEPVRERRDIPASRLTSALGRFAKSLRWQGLYKNLKFLELSERTRLRDYVAHHDPPDLILTDGDPLINTAAWAVARFYRRQLADDDSLLEMLRYVVGEQRLSGAAVLRYLRTGWQLIPLNLLRLGRFTYPDLVVLLEIDPSAAMARIRARGRPLQVHETEAFLSELSMAYARVCGLLQARVGVPVLRIRADQVSLENIVQTVDTAITERLESERQARGSRPVVAGGIEVVATTMSGSLQDQQKIELIEPDSPLPAHALQGVISSAVASSSCSSRNAGPLSPSTGRAGSPGPPCASPSSQNASCPVN